MAVTHEDITELKKVFDDRYVLQSDCDAVQTEMNKRFSRDDKKLAVLDLKMTACLWLMGVVASGIVALVIRVYLG
jgi:hypothetical protein